MMSIAVLLALPWTPELTRPSPPRDPAHAQTVAGAFTRGSRRLEPANRQEEFDRTPDGARGRSNATLDAVRAGENFPGFVDRNLQTF
jgi:hypothetical protein